MRRRTLLAGLGTAAAAAAWPQARSAGCRYGCGTACAPGAAPAARAAAASGRASAPNRNYRSERVLTSDGVGLHLLLAPAPTGVIAATEHAPSLLFVPGWCMPADLWEQQLDGLGPRWTAAAMDPRGQGTSDVATSGYTLERRADDIAEVVAALVARHDSSPRGDGGATQRPVVLIAWSLGVLEALEYVQRHGSGRLAALVLVDNSIGEPPAPGGSGFLRRLRQDRARVLEEFIRGMFVHPPPAARIAALHAAALRMPLDSSIALLSYPRPRAYWREITHGFDRPLAYVVTPRFREQARHLRAARPASRIEVFERAGHALFVDEAQRFNALLAQWLLAVSPSGSQVAAPAQSA